jgi:hypothetical protein
VSGRSRIILVAATAVLAAGAAQAACISVGQLRSCVLANGEVLQMYCIGTGEVRTCQEFSGAWIEIGRPKLLSQVLSDAELSASAARAGARRAAEADEPKEAGNPPVAQQPRQHGALRVINPPAAGVPLLPPAVSQRKAPPR